MSVKKKLDYWQRRGESCLADIRDAVLAGDKDGADELSREYIEIRKRIMELEEKENAELS